MRPAILVTDTSLVLVAGISASPAAAHRNGCHPKHACPSDHGTYVWNGKRCVKPGSPKQDGSFKKKTRFGGRTYYCKRA